MTGGSGGGQPYLDYISKYSREDMQAQIREPEAKETWQLVRNTPESRFCPENEFTRTKMMKIVTRTSRASIAARHKEQLESKNDGILRSHPILKSFHTVSKSTKRYSATNNLRTHVETHDGISVAAGNYGGRVSQKAIDQAVLLQKLVTYGPWHI
ncbi:hypothetical protein DTO164E3_4299 [Paecilomyces variotii]|nr:hypothetical protein DTO164E3_4299 [Paecilomyces variotii]KAJ9267139.1 hypothetical protein DTO212C5_6057 [Paecilomyces variotii]KAJ9409334.1 hypothetical protein DTO045G8_3102 [Paecilomyces variotii]